MSCLWVLPIPRLISLSLFGFRVVGVILFETIQWRELLFIFPNLFENWFLFVLVAMRFFPSVQLLTWRQCLTWFTILYIPKLAQNTCCMYRKRSHGTGSRASSESDIRSQISL